MNFRLLFALIIILLSDSLFSQRSYLHLSFTARYHGNHIAMDSIRISNLTRDGDTVLFFPDTVLSIDLATFLPDADFPANESLVLRQNFPNPFTENTQVTIVSGKEQIVHIAVTDGHGSQLLQEKLNFSQGEYVFSFTPGKEKIYYLSIVGSGSVGAIKMIKGNTSGQSGTSCSLEMISFNSHSYRKSFSKGSPFVFEPGDLLRYIAYATTGGFVTGTHVIEDQPGSDTLYVMEIAEGIPCPDVPLLHYEGQDYLTVFINGKCWMKENLNHSVISSWCYGQLSSNCDEYGRLYTWDAMMAGASSSNSVPSGVQGICPDGWHIPSMNEWNLLINALGGNGIAGGKMKETGTSHWMSPNTGASNVSGFMGLPGGGRTETGEYQQMGGYGCFWSTTQRDLIPEHAWYKYLLNEEESIDEWYFYKEGAFSVRCLKD